MSEDEGVEKRALEYHILDERILFEREIILTYASVFKYASWDWEDIRWLMLIIPLLTFIKCIFICARIFIPGVKKMTFIKKGGVLMTFNPRSRAYRKLVTMKMLEGDEETLSKEELEAWIRRQS